MIIKQRWFRGLPSQTTAVFYLVSSLKLAYCYAILREWIICSSSIGILEEGVAVSIKIDIRSRC